MGILSRLKELFSRKSIDSFKEIENEFNKLLKKSNSEIIALIGISGKPKGLPLVYSSYEEDSIKKYAARMAELVNPLENLSEEREIKEFIIYYKDSNFYFNPIMKDIGFFAVIQNKNDISHLRNWISNNNLNLKEIFHYET